MNRFLEGFSKQLFFENWENKIIEDDNIIVLKKLIKMKNEGGIRNQDGTSGVRLVYIDPPFSTDKNFYKDKEIAYSDKIKGNEYVKWLKKRIVLIKKMLSYNGVLCVHLDWRRAHYIKILLDEIFGEENFVNEIVWHYGTHVGKCAGNFPKKHDNILVYRNTKKDIIFFPQRDGIPENDANYKRWKRYFNENNEITGGDYPSEDSKFDGYVKRFIKEHGRQPRSEDVLLRVDGKLVDSVWDIQAVNPMSKEKNGYPTQKPEELLKRIISSFSKEGDIVMDCFCGSGTAAVVAQKTNRRWIAIDCGEKAIEITKNRILDLDSNNAFSIFYKNRID